MADLDDQKASVPQANQALSLFKKPFFYSSIVALVVACFVGSILFTRYDSDRTIEKRNAVKAEQQRRANDLAAIEQLGGSQFAIRALYVSPSVIPQGEKAQLCYDVSNAKSVTLDPPVAEVWPSHTRCFDVEPQRTTSYTLTIKDAAGQTVSQSVKLEVRGPLRVHNKSFPSQ